MKFLPSKTLTIEDEVLDFNEFLKTQRKGFYNKVESDEEKSLAAKIPRVSKLGVFEL